MANLENQKRRILVVDDDPQLVKIVVRALEYEGYNVSTADSGQKALECMSKGSPHLVLLDVSMPGLSGLETLQLLRTKHDYVSVIFLTAKSKPEDVVRGLDAGADDYLCKPFDVLELLSRVRSQLRIKDLHDDLRKANERLKELVDIDDLTGLFNMRSLYKKLDFELERSRRHKGSLCVLMMDMDHFKQCNDRHDHLFGSYVLSQVGKIIRENMRKTDFAARYGGDEFLIVLTDMDSAGAMVFAERLRGLISKCVFENDIHAIKLTASFGFSVKKGASEINSRSLVRFADRGLYKAKEQGRNRVVEYEYTDAQPISLRKLA